MPVAPISANPSVGFAGSAEAGAGTRSKRTTRKDWPMWVIKNETTGERLPIMGTVLDRESVQELCDLMNAEHEPDSEHVQQDHDGVVQRYKVVFVPGL